jgi:hypothetical protein
MAGDDPAMPLCAGTGPANSFEIRRDRETIQLDPGVPVCALCAPQDAIRRRTPVEVRSFDRGVQIVE